MHSRISEQKKKKEKKEKKPKHRLCIISARKTATCPFAIFMDSKSGYPETTGADCGSDADEADVGEEKEDFLGGGEVVAPVHVEPENAREAICKLLE